MIPLKDTIPHRHTPFITYLLIITNVLIFLFERSLNPYYLKQLVYTFGLVPARYSHPEWASFFGLHIDNYWPFFTCIFLHGGWFHIISNMWSLWLFGDNVEDKFGHFGFLVFYIICGLIASFVHYFFNINSIVPVIGASGAIAGVMGAYFVMFPRSRILTLIPIFFIPFFIEIPAVIFLGFWFLSQLFSGTFMLFAASQASGIAWWAHIGGFVAGIILHKIFKKDNRDYFPDEYYYKYYH
jgi:membrane associated rhomboid family serine protease